ncbi:conserved domain protein [Streptococcus infantis SK970]|nr:conserved domain protein [Streptococcus infantis SK970]
MNPRLSLYFSEETHEKFKEIKSYLKESSALQKQYRNNSATLVTLIEVFYKLFIELGEGKNFYERLTQLEKILGMPLILEMITRQFIVNLIKFSI